MEFVRSRYTTWYHSDPPYTFRTAYRPGIPLLRDAIERLARVTSDPHTIVTGALNAHWWFVRDFQEAQRSHHTRQSDRACTFNKTVILVAQFAADVAHLATRNGEGSLHDQCFRACILAISTAKNVLGIPEKHAYFPDWRTKHELVCDLQHALLGLLACSRDRLFLHVLPDQERARLAILPTGLRDTAMNWYAAVYAGFPGGSSEREASQGLLSTQAIADAIADYWATVDGEPAMAFASVSHAIEVRMGVRDRLTRIVQSMTTILTVLDSYSPEDNRPVRMTDLETDPRACLAEIGDARQRRQDLITALRRDIAELQRVNDDWDKAFARWERVLKTH